MVAELTTTQFVDSRQERALKAVWRRAAREDGHTGMDKHQDVFNSYSGKSLEIVRLHWRDLKDLL